MAAETFSLRRFACRGGAQDRVHPRHARKMPAKLQALAMTHCSTTGGHGDGKHDAEVAGARHLGPRFCAGESAREVERVVWRAPQVLEGSANQPERVP